MKSLFTQEQFDLAKSEDKLLCQCYYCNNSFEITKHKIKDALNPNHKAIEAILKLSDVEALVFQMKWRVSKTINVDLDKLDILYKKYEVPEGTKVMYCLFSKPGKNNFDSQKYFIIESV